MWPWPARRCRGCQRQTKPKPAQGHGGRKLNRLDPPRPRGDATSFPAPTSQRSMTRFNLLSLKGEAALQICTRKWIMESPPAQATLVPTGNHPDLTPALGESHPGESCVREHEQGVPRRRDRLSLAAPGPPPCPSPTQIAPRGPHRRLAGAQHFYSFSDTFVNVQSDGKHATHTAHPGARPLRVGRGQASMP